MKKINVLFIAVGIAVAGFMSSCTKDSTDTSFSDPTITINLTGGTLVGNTVTELPGTALTFDIKFGMGDQSDKLVAVKISSLIDNKTFTIIDSTLNSGFLNGADEEFTYTYNTNVGKNPEQLVISVTDKKNRTKTETITINPKAVVGDFIVTEAVLLGAQSNVTGSFYSVDLGRVINLSDANKTPTNIDFVYYYGSNNLATLSSPINPDAAKVFSSISSWSTKNTTLYKQVTSDDYETTTTSVFDAAIASIGTDTQETQLTTSMYIAFKTTSGKSGIIKIKDIVTSATGKMTISIKMKK